MAADIAQIIVIESSIKAMLIWGRRTERRGPGASSRRGEEEGSDEDISKARKV